MKNVTATHSQLKMIYQYKTKSYEINLKSITIKLLKFYGILKNEKNNQHKSSFHDFFTELYTHDEYLVYNHEKN